MVQIWKYDQDFNKVYIEEIDTKEEILTLEGCRLHCTYYQKGKGPAWDIIYPLSHDKDIMEILEKFQNKAQR